MLMAFCMISWHVMLIHGAWFSRDGESARHPPCFNDDGTGSNFSDENADTRSIWDKRSGQRGT